MSSISPASSASNVRVPVDGVVLPPALLVKQLDGFSLADKKEVICEYYKACVAAAAAGGSFSRVSASEVSRGSVVSVESKGGTEGFVGAVGKCYLRAVRRDQRVAVFKKLGVEPTFQQLLELPRHLYLPDAVLKKIRVKCGFSGLHHLAGDGQYDFLELVLLLAQQSTWRPKTLAAKAVATDKRGVVSEVVAVKLSDKLGAQVDPVEGMPVSINELFREGQGVDLSVSWTVGQIMRLSVSRFRPRQELLDIGVTLADDGTIFLQRLGGQVTWMTYVTCCARDIVGEFSEGTLGRALLRCGSDPYWAEEWLWPKNPRFQLVQGTESEEYVTLEVEGEMRCMQVAAYMQHVDDFHGVDRTSERFVKAKVFGSRIVDVSELSFCEGDKMRCSGIFLAITGKYRIAGWVVDATQVQVGLNLYSEVECLQSGSLIRLPPYADFARSSSNVDNMHRCYGNVKLEVFWTHTAHNVAVKEFESCSIDESDGTSAISCMVDSLVPFQVLNTPWTGATYVKAGAAVKVKFGCFSGEGVDAVVHRGMRNFSVLGIVFSTKSKGFVEVLGVMDREEWDCVYNSDLGDFE